MLCGKIWVLTNGTYICYNTRHMKTKISKIYVTFFLGISFIFMPSFALAEANSPSAITGSARNGAVFLQWNNTSPAINHVIEYKPTTSTNWNNYPHPTSATPGIVVHNLNNGTSYDFRVSTITADGTSLPTSPISVTPSSNYVNTGNNQIISTGQSNAIGAENSILSTTQPYNNRMLNGGRTALVPLVEPVAGFYGGIGETMASGLANSLSYFTSTDPVPHSAIMSLGAQGAMIYTALMQGTPIYNSLIADVTAAKNFSIAENKTHVVRALTVIHGETDEYTPTSAEQYEQYLVEWQSDYQNDIQAITGQEEPVIMFTDQMNGHQNLNSPVPHIALAQYNAAKNNPNTIIMVTPKYILPTSDWLGHLTSYSQRRLGEYYAKVYKKVIIDGEQWKPVMPESIEMTGNVIHAEFHVPVPPLVFDTTAVLFKYGYGFEYADSTNSAFISSVELSGPTSVDITLTNVPTGSNPRLRYAYTGVVSSWSTGPMAPNSSRGNLRDSDMTEAPHQDGNVPAFMGNYLRNWAVAFDEAITVMPNTPSAPISVTATLGSVNGTAVVSFALPAGSPPATSYLVTSAPGNIVATGTGSPITISGLSNNTTYTFTVIAQNGGSQSAPSAPSNSVRPHWITAAPQVVGPLTKPKVPISLKPERKSGPVRPTSEIQESQKASVIESVAPIKEEVKTPAKEASVATSKESIKEATATEITSAEKR